MPFEPKLFTSSDTPPSCFRPHGNVAPGRRRPARDKGWHLARPPIPHVREGPAYPRHALRRGLRRQATAARLLEPGPIRGLCGRSERGRRLQGRQREGTRARGYAAAQPRDAAHLRRRLHAADRQAARAAPRHAQNVGGERGPHPRGAQGGFEPAAVRGHLLRHQGTAARDRPDDQEPSPVGGAGVQGLQHVDFPEHPVATEAAVRLRARHWLVELPVLSLADPGDGGHRSGQHGGAQTMQRLERVLTTTG
mmetsp:Transcript_72457/g.206289  ORF Transcript_72457/g.206289 Transcript_72457/m.206289 type:complete len:251 (-) Transcript_72457:1238-1990(-)